MDDCDLWFFDERDTGSDSDVTEEARAFVCCPGPAPTTYHAGPPASNSLKSTTTRADLGDDLHFPHSDTAPAPTPARPVVIAGPQRSALSSGQLSQQLGGGGGGGGCVLGRLPMGSLPVRTISAPAASMGTSVPIAIPNFSRWPHPSDPSTPAAAAAANGEPFVPPHRMTARGEDFAFTADGGSPSGCLRRDRLRTRNAILRVTGFLEGSGNGR